MSEEMHKTGSKAGSRLLDWEGDILKKNKFLCFMLGPAQTAKFTQMQRIVPGWMQTCCSIRRRPACYLLPVCDGLFA